MKIVSDVLHLSYFDKFGLRVTVKAGQALACLYSEARLYIAGSMTDERLVLYRCYTF